MCSECDWSEKDTQHQILSKCDCGNFKWQKTSLLSEVPHHPLLLKNVYRCTKCDSLSLAEHLLHRLTLQKK